jgi:hypothetical protein
VKRASDGSKFAAVPAETSNIAITLTRHNARGRLAGSLDFQFFSLQSLAAYAGLYEEPMTRWMSQFCSAGKIGLRGDEIEDELARTLAHLKIEAPSSERTPLPMISFNPTMGQRIQVEVQAMKECWLSWCQGSDASLTPPYIFLGAAVLDSAFEEIVMPKVEGRTSAEVTKKKRKRWVRKEPVTDCL